MFMPNNAHFKIYFILLQFPAINDALVKTALLMDQILHYWTWGCIERKWTHRQYCVIRCSPRKLFKMYKYTDIHFFALSVISRTILAELKIFWQITYIFILECHGRQMHRQNAKINRKHNPLRAYSVRTASNKNRTLVIIKVQKTEVYHNLCTREWLLFSI